MKKFMAIYTGTQSSMEKWKSLDPARQAEQANKGMKAWTQWGAENAKVILDGGGPLGVAKRVTASGVSDIHNSMSAYVIIHAESHDSAAKLFLNHPHFSIFPGDGVEIMECLPVPSRSHF